jgi:hypothetical protein
VDLKKKNDSQSTRVSKSVAFGQRCDKRVLDLLKESAAIVLLLLVVFNDGTSELHVDGFEQRVWRARAQGAQVENGLSLDAKM